MHFTKSCVIIMMNLFICFSQRDYIKEYTPHRCWSFVRSNVRVQCNCDGCFCSPAPFILCCTLELIKIVCGLCFAWILNDVPFDCQTVENHLITSNNETHCFVMFKLGYFHYEHKKWFINCVQFWKLKNSIIVQQNANQFTDDENSRWNNNENYFVQNSNHSIVD